MTKSKDKLEFYSKINLKSQPICTQNEVDANELSLYVHIPFCEKKCNYCNFVSFCGCLSKVDEYIECLINELRLRKSDDCNLKSIYIGGGTPSLLTCEQIEKLMLAIKENCKIKDNAEITIELNPNSVTKEKLEVYHKLGINRISVGIQSLSNRKLKKLGRLHSRKQAIDALTLISSCGFKNISCDLIIGLPHQSNFEVRQSIKKLSKFATHFSVYGLSVEDGTLFNQMLKGGKLKLPTESKCATQYLKVVKYLRKLGYERYEVSNFALNGFQSMHNKTYWEMGDYLGLGVASHSFISGERIANTEKLEIYLTNLSNNKIAYKSEKVSDTDLLEETIMLSLRESKGLNLQDFNLRFGKDLLVNKKNEIVLLKELKLVEVEGDYLKVTDKGFLVLNQIIIKLI